MFNANIREIKLLSEGNSRIILKNIAFILAPGNVYSIIGKNGSGKTTLLKSLTALHDRKVIEVEGNIEFNGMDILTLTYDRLSDIRKKYIKYVFQDPVLSFNHLKKMEYYFKMPGIDEKKLGEFLDLLMLPDRKSLSNKYPYELSGGMAQRISIALALAAAPKLLFLDEPNSGIDFAVSNMISKILKKYAAESKAAILIITQDIAFAENTAGWTGFIDNYTFSGFFSKNEIFSTGGKNTGFGNIIEVYRNL